MARKQDNKGVLKTWKDDRGFGFIKPEDGSEDIFIHISALKGSSRRPHRGDIIYYQVEQSDDGKLKAINAGIEGVEKVAQSGGSKKWLWLAVLFLIAVGGIAAYSLKLI